MKRTSLFLVVLVLLLVTFASTEENTQFFGAIKRAAKRAAAGLKKTATKAKNAITKSAKKVGAGVKKAAKKVKDGVKKAAKKVKEGVKKVATKIKDKLKGPKITYYPRATQLSLALLASHLSYSAYQSTNYPYNTNPAVFFDQSKFVKTIDTTKHKQRIISKVIVNDQLKVVAVGVRGTQTKESKDILTNLKLTFAKCQLKDATGKMVDCGKVHKGFWQDVSQQFELIRDAIRPFVAQGYGILVTGHSQGAAEALIIGLYLKLQFPAVQNFNVIGFGTPRTGNKDFVKAINSRNINVTRFVTRSKGLLRTADPVSNVPPKLFKYAHVGNQINLDCKSKLALKCHPIVNYIAGIGGVDIASVKKSGAAIKRPVKKSTATRAKKTVKKTVKTATTKKTSTKKRTAKKTVKKTVKKTATKKTVKKTATKKASKKTATKKTVKKTSAKKTAISINLVNKCKKTPKWVKINANECVVKAFVKYN